MRSIKTFVLLSAIVLFASMTFSSCSKKVKLEKRLDGSWTITSWTKTEHANNVFAYTITTTGNLVLIKKGNTGTLTLKDPLHGDEVYQISSWTNTTDQVTLVTGADIMTFTIVENSKTTQTWSRTDSFTDASGDDIKDEYTVKMTKD